MYHKYLKKLYRMRKVYYTNLYLWVYCRLLGALALWFFVVRWIVGWCFCGSLGQ